MKMRWLPDYLDKNFSRIFLHWYQLTRFHSHWSSENILAFQICKPALWNTEVETLRPWWEVLLNSNSLIEFLLPFLCATLKSFFVLSEVALPQVVNFPTPEIHGLILLTNVTSSPSTRTLKKREIHRLRSQHLRAYKTIGRKVEAILERCNVHKFILNRKKIIILI